MGNQAKYMIWGYCQDKENGLHFVRILIGKAETIEDARKIKEDSEKIERISIICIFKGDYIVEPSIWKGRKEPYEPPSI